MRKVHVKISDGISDRELFERALMLTVQYIQNAKLGESDSDVVSAGYWLDKAMHDLLEERLNNYES